MRKLLLLLIVCILTISLIGCSSNNTSIEETKKSLDNLDISEVVNISGIIENIVVFDTYKEITISNKEEIKTFVLKNSIHIFDKSHHPKIEPYLEIGTYIDIEVEKEEYNKNKPIIKRITVTSYDGVFTV